MTLKEFSRKYDVPYHIVYTASYKVQPESTWFKDKDYPEKELREQVLIISSKAVEKHMRLMELHVQVMKNLEGKK